LAGEGELLAQTRVLAAELGLEAATFFPGHCSRVSELLSVSDVCVLSSKAVEGFSNSIIEYMAAARPVVATDVGGAREAVVDGLSGYIVPPGNHKMMADRIISLLNDPVLARQMGQAGLRIVKEKFSCEAQLNGIESLYARYLGNSHGSR
ncbi:MAG TPA: glycosyltransferase, partial [Pyrinomonadaceae bacterium]|nr:glycosyltransferase [Pyrinomonadaceae bacterium]